MPLTLLERLELQPDEAAVLSVIYDIKASEPVARHVSLLFGPPEMAQSTWLDWYRLHVELAARVPGEGVFPAAFAHENHGVLIGREQVTLHDAEGFVEGLLEGRLPAAGQIPAANVAVKNPDAPIRVFPHRATPGSRLAAMAGRPLRAYLFRSKSLDPTVPAAFARPWTVSDQLVHAPHLWHVGISLRNGATEHAPQGVLIGRLERRAWIRETRGVDDQYALYLIRIGLDPTFISPYELVIELQEFIDDELAVARRLPLDWIDLSAWNAQDHVDLAVPMLGRGARRAVSLYDLGGELLDVTDAVALVESVRLKIKWSEPGGATTTDSFTIGGMVHPTLDERLDRLDAIDDQFRKLIEEGMPGRIIVHGSQGAPFLTQRLQAARHELRIMDRYFGAEPSDWAIFKQVSVPVRVLITQAATKPPAWLTGVEVRKWRQPKKGDAPPFHDRLYLWEGGGLSVGTSVGTLGTSDIRIDSVDPVEAEAWSARFESYWNSPLFVLV